MMKPDKDPEGLAEAFVIKSYLKSELAQLYFPYLTSAAALKKLRKWISANDDLHRRLYSGCEGKNDQTFSRRQVAVLVAVLDPP